MKLFPASERPTDRRELAARKLRAVLLGLLITVSLLFPLLGLAHPHGWSRCLGYVAAVDGVLILLLLLTGRGRIRLASSLLVVLTTAILTLAAWTSGGVHSPAMLAFLLVVGIAGALQGPLAAGGTAIAVATITLGLLTAELSGRLPPPALQETPVSQWLVMVFILAEIVVVQVMVAAVVRRAEQQARASAAAREATEAARRESEEKFAKIFHASPDAIAITELSTGRFIEVNASHERIFGWPRTALIGRTVLERGFYVDPRDRDRLVAAVQRRELVRDWEITVRTRTGRELAVLVSAEPIELRGRGCLTTVVHDITARKRSENALRESQERFLKIFQTSPDAIAISDMDTGQIVEANASYEKLSGYSRSELVGRTTAELQLYADPADRQRLIDLLDEHGSVRDWELHFRSRQGRPITGLYSGERIELDGQVRLLSVLHDITERRAAEARERAAREDFTRRLLASQEAERRRIARELHDSLGQNLIVLKNRAQLGGEGATLPPEVQSRFRDLAELANQALAEVRQISHDLRPHQLDQLGLTRALETMIDGVAQSSRFPIERKLDPVDDLFAPEAATHLYRVAQESLSNVLKHAQAKHARVGLERDVHDVRLWIEDDGRGGAVAASPALASTGAGFGLSNIAERVRILGGHLEMNSVPGRGTRIEVVIPQA